MLYHLKSVEGAVILDHQVLLLVDREVVANLGSSVTTLVIYLVILNPVCLVGGFHYFIAHLDFYVKKF